MEVIDGLLSNDIGYLHALRYAEQLPVIKKQVVVSKKGISTASVVGGIGCILIISYFVYEYQIAKKKSRKK